VARVATRKKPLRKNLREYARKRDFAVTPEPAPGGVTKAAERPTFMVHKHHARRLHYDVRLEMDGALASWAVPKGPSYDPSVKRLAVQTEDHPLEYGQFEGRIPDGEYGAGDSLIWDRGTYDTVPPGQASAQRKKGHLHVEFFGEKLKGRWHFVRTRPVGGKSQWLMFKAGDEHANAKYDVIAERPESVASGRVSSRGPESAKTLRSVHPVPDRLLAKMFPIMLATLVDAPPADEENWIFELKYDGYRAISALSGGRVAMWTRNKLDLTERFPRIAQALGRVTVGEAVIDGEICALDPQGAPKFELMQQGAEDVLFVFDLLWLDGEDLRERPLEQRRDLLVSLLANSPSELRLAERVEGSAKDALAAAERGGYEGLISKQRGSLYESRRSRSWQKLKVQANQELAIIGFTPSTNAPASQIGALLLAVYEGDHFVFAGKVGTGFTSKMRRELYRELKEDRTSDPPAADAPRIRVATWVKPRLVAQVRFTEWTSDGKLRHPSFQGLRADKSPTECVREKPAAKTPAKPGRIDVKLTHPDKVMYPRDGYTKQDVADYYAAVSEAMIRALRGRPLALQHWNQGIAREPWFQQNIGKEAEPWMTLALTPTSTARGSARHLVVDRPETLQWLAQHSVLTIHMWHSRAETLRIPDWVVWDLDPAEGHGIEQAVEAAHALEKLFERLSLPSAIKTSGKRGLHVFVPLAQGHTHEDALEFALAVGRAVAGVLPSVTLERSISKRRGRLYLDCMQNGYGKTIVAPYSPRGLDGAPVSAPLRWSEVGPRLDPMQFTIKSMPKRLDRVGDLFDAATRDGVRLPRVR
jgi:bifunctional non-homologous end joining protein LigD